MKFKRRLKIEEGGRLDLTALVNVFFLLLIFFLFTSSFIFQPGIKVDLPRTVTSEVVPQESTAIIVNKDDRIYLDDKEISRNELASKLEIIAKEKGGLLIKADSRATHGRIVEIWDMCRNIGVTQVSIATSQ